MPEKHQKIIVSCDECHKVPLQTSKRIFHKQHLKDSRRLQKVHQQRRKIDKE